MVIGHNPTRVSTLALAVLGWIGCCKSHLWGFGSFDPRFSNSLSMHYSVTQFLWHFQKVKKKCWREFRPYAFFQDFRWTLTQGSRVLFRTWTIWKIDAVILFKTNMAEYKYDKYPWTVIFLFKSLMNPKGKKRINKVLSKQSKQFLWLSASAWINPWNGMPRFIAQLRNIFVPIWTVFVIIWVVPWEDIFKLSVSAASEFCEWIQVGIDVLS